MVAILVFSIAAAVQTTIWQIDGAPHISQDSVLFGLILSYCMVVLSIAVICNTLGWPVRHKSPSSDAGCDD